MKVSVLYFASLRETLGLGREQLDLPGDAAAPLREQRELGGQRLERHLAAVASAQPGAVRRDGAERGAAHAGSPPGTGREPAPQKCSISRTSIWR